MTPNEALARSAGISAWQSDYHGCEAWLSAAWLSELAAPLLADLSNLLAAHAAFAEWCATNGRNNVR